MSQRILSIWFPYVITDWFTLQQPELGSLPFVAATPGRGRMVITAANTIAQATGIITGMVVADARAVLPSLQVIPDQPELATALLDELGTWCLRYTPLVAIDRPDSLLLDITGCAHLWGGEAAYLADIAARLHHKGYHTRMAITDTPGAAWAVARFGKNGQTAAIVAPGAQQEAILPLPPAALRLEPGILERLQKLGLSSIRSFIHMPRTALRRRFGTALLQRLDQALGTAPERLQPIRSAVLFQERLPVLEPVVTAPGIERALRQLLEALCQHLLQEGKGLRTALFTCYRVDGKTEQIGIGTHRASRNIGHLFRLFELKIATITPALGIELFLLEAPVVEELSIAQESLWNEGDGRSGIVELLDRLSGRLGAAAIRRYLPQEHHWPERSIKETIALEERPATAWRTDRPRPLQLLSQPQVIEVTVPVPDYPPLLFRYQGRVHKIVKADGPERIEQEWWLEEGLHRDYYCVEDEQGARYWLFRSGHYNDEASQWFIHGFFA